MKAKLFLKGNREPYEIDVEVARAIEKMITSSSPDNTPVSIPDVFTGVKGDLKYVTYEKEPNYESHNRLTFDDKQAEEFEYEIAEFLVKGSLNMESEMDLLFSKGFINIDKKHPKGENKTISDFDLRVVTPNLAEYKLFSDRLEAWKEHKAKKEFAESQKLKALEIINEKKDDTNPR